MRYLIAPVIWDLGGLRRKSRQGSVASMQDRYVGDVGDFGKYGLLRRLCGRGRHEVALRLGVLWYRFEGSDRSNDGRHIQYICCPSSAERQLRKCDSDLFVKMRSLVIGNRRSIAEVEAGGVLPPGTIFFGRELDFGRVRSIDERGALRKQWLASASAKLAEAEVIFADPDNGLQVPSCGPLSAGGPKYAYYDDLRPFWEDGKSLIVYHHIGRTYRGCKADAEKQISHRRDELREEMDGARPLALRFRRRSSRVYFVLPNRGHVDKMKARIQAIIDSPWSGGRPPHFELVDP